MSHNVVFSGLRLFTPLWGHVIMQRQEVFDRG